MTDNVRKLDFSLTEPSRKRSMFNTITGGITPVISLGGNAPYVDFNKAGRANTQYLGEAGESKYDTNLSRQNVQHLDYFRHENQSGIDQFGNMLNQAVVGEIVGGTIEGIGHLLGVEDAYKLATDQEVDLGNWLTDIGKDLRTWTQEVTPIYTDPSKAGQFSPGDWSWWMSNAPSVASTLSLLIPAAGVVKGASMVGKALNIGQKMGKTAKWMATGLSQAVVSRHMENLMEASGKYDEIIDRGGSAEQASLAASDIYKTNWAMLVQDIPQYLTLGAVGGKVFSKTSAKLAKKMGTMGALEANMRTTGALAADWAGEGFEEAFQYIVSENADEMSKATMNPDYNPKQLTEYLKEGELWTSAFFGMFGAGVFQSVGRHINKKILGREDEDDRKIDAMKKNAMFNKLYFNAIIKADKKGDIEKVEELKDDMLIMNTGTIYGIDGSDSYAQQKIEVLEKLATEGQLSEEDIELTGLDEESLAYMKEKFPDYIKSIKDVGKEYETIIKDSRLKGKKNKEILAGNLAANTVLKHRLIERLTNREEKLREIENQLERSTEYKNLSSNGKDIFKFQQKRNAIGATRQDIKNELKGRITKEKHEQLINYDKKLAKKQDALDKERDKAINEEGYKGTGIQKSDVENSKQLDTDSLKKEHFSKLLEIENNEKAIDSKVNTIKELWETDPKVEKVKPSQSPEQAQDNAQKETDKLKEQQEEIERKQKEKSEFAVHTINDKVEERFPNEGDYGKVLYSGEEVPKRGILSKKEDGYYFTDEETGEITKVDIAPGNSFKSNGLMLLEPTNTATSKQPVDTEATSEQDNIPLADNVTTKEAEVTGTPWEGKVIYEIGYDKKAPVNKELNEYLSDPNNDLSDAVLEPYIDWEDKVLQKDESLLKRLKSGTTGILTDEDVSKVPLRTRLVLPGGDVIPGEMWIYFPKSKQYPRPPIKRDEETKKAYAKAFSAESLAVRKSIIPLLVDGVNVQFTKLGKTRGVINTTGDNINILDAFELDLKDIDGVLGVSTRSGKVQKANDETIGTISASSVGGVYMETNKTANGNPMLIKLNSVKLKHKGTQYADIIYSAFQQALNNEVENFNEVFKGDNVGGTLSNHKVLEYLVNYGGRTAVNNEKYHPEYERKHFEERYDQLRRKQLYYSHSKHNKSGVIHYGANPNDLDANGKPNPYRIKTKGAKEEDIKHFKEYITENLNFAVRYKKFADKIKAPFKIGDIEVTQDEVDNNITYEQFVLKKDYVTSDAKVVNGSITKDAYVTVDTNSFEEVVTPNEEQEIIPEPTVEAEQSQEPSKKVADIFRKRSGIKGKTNNRLYKGRIRYTKWNQDKEIARVRKMIGEDVPIDIADKLIEVINYAGSHKAFGQVRNGSMLLYKNAEEGTGYHEAFHIVSLYYLTEKEQNYIYRNAEKTYPQLKGTSKSVKEEFLAEEFRKFVLSKPQELSKPIREFFQKLLDFIVNLFVNKETRISKLTTEQLFNKIESGYFKKAKSNKNFAKENNIHQYLREEFTLEQINKITDGLFYHLITLNNLTDTESLIKNSEINYKIVYDELQNIIRESSELSEDETQDKVDRQEGDRVANLYSRVTSDKLWPMFQQKMEQRLKAMGIGRKEAFDENDDDVTSKEFKRFDSATYEFDSKDTVLNNIKVFIATLPGGNDIDPYTYMPRLVDFQTAWSRIMKDAWKAKNIYDLERILREKSRRSLFYETLLQGNELRFGIENAPEEFRTQIEVAFNKYKHDFINFVHKSEEKINEQTGNSYTIHDYYSTVASTVTAEEVAAQEWSTQFYESAKFYDEEDKPNIKKLNSISDKYVNKYKSIVDEYTNTKKFEDYEGIKYDVKKTLSSIYINLDNFTLDDVIDDLGRGDKQKGLFKLITEILDPIFQVKDSLIGDIKTGRALKRDGKPVLIENVLSNNSRIQRLAKIVVKNNDDYVQDIVLGPDNAMFYVYSQSSYMTEFNKRNYTFDAEKNKYILSEDFMNLHDAFYNANSYFIKQIEQGKQLEIKTIANIRSNSKNKGYLDITDKQDFLLKMNLMVEGYLPMPTLADRKSYYVFDGIKPIEIDTLLLDDGGNVEVPAEVINIFKGYVLDERNRIERVTSDIADAIDKKYYRNLVQNMHYMRVDADGIPILKGHPEYKDKEDTPNGLKYHVFTDLNDGKPVTNNAIKKLLSQRINDTIDTAVNLGVIGYSEKKGITNKVLDNKDIINYKSKVGGNSDAIQRSNAIKTMLAEYTINTIITGVETDKLLVGDPAYYKSDKKGSIIEDKIKRINAIVAPGDKLRVHYKNGEFAGVTQYNVATLQDYKLDAKELIGSLRILFEEQGLSEKEINERLKAYTEVNVTDAQAYITPRFHRELKIRLGEWRDADEEAYNLLMSGEEIPEDKLELVNKLIMEPVKYVHYGMYYENGYMVPIYDKMSMATLWPSMVKGKKIEALYNKMTDESKPIDMVKFESAVKVGNRPRPKYFIGEEEVNTDPLNNIEVYKQDLENLRRQQVTTPHDTAVRLLATQVKKVVMANLKMDVDYIVNGVVKSSEQVAEIFDKSYSALSQKGLEKLQDIIGLDLETGKVDTAKLYDRLQKDAENGNLPQQVIDALFVGDDGKYINLDTLPDRKWVETRLIALAGKYTIDVITPGDAFVQMSNFGLNKEYDDKLKLMDENNQTEIMVSTGLYKNVIPDYYKKTFQEKKDWLNDNKELIEGIGYRIPTQGQNSVISFKVVDFIEEASGNTVILPAEFTALTGSDFDIDKLFLATYNYNTKGNNIEKIGFIEADGEVTDIGLLESYWKQNNLRAYNFIKRLESILDKTENNNLNEYDQEYLRLKHPELIDSLGRVKTEEVAELIKKEHASIVLLEDYIKNNKGKDQYQLNSEQAIQNRILDTMKGVMVNPNHILETKTPLDTYTGKIKDIVGIYRRLTGQDRQLSSLEAYAPAYQHNVKKSYTGGKTGIGPFALNNVHHSLTQIWNVLLDATVKDNEGKATSNYYDFANTSDGKVDLSQQKGIDGLYIIDWLSALINAHVDIAKDPYIFDLNINKGTYNLVNYLIRAGAGEKTFWFMIQPGVTNFEMKWEEIVYTKGKDAGHTKDKIDSDINKMSNPKYTFQMTDKELQDQIIEGQKPEEERSYEWWYTQIGIQKAYKELSKKARHMSSFVSLSRTDGKGYGNTTNEVFEFNDNYNAFTGTNKFDGATDVLNDSFIGKYEKNAVGSIMNIMKNINMAATPSFRAMYKKLIDVIDKPDSEDFRYKDAPWDYANDIEEYNKTVSILENKLYSTIISDFFNTPIGFNIDQAQYKELFKGKDSVGSRAYRIFNENEDLKDNYFVRHIKPVKPLKGKNSEAWLIKALNGDKTDRFQRDNIVDGWASLLEHPKEEVQKLAEDLIAASFFLSGFSRNLYSFYHNIPIGYLIERSRFGDKTKNRSYDEFITHIKNRLDTEDYNEEAVNKIIDDVIANNQERFNPVSVQSRVKRTSSKNPYMFVSQEKYDENSLPPKYAKTTYTSNDIQYTVFGQLLGKHVEDGKYIYRIIPKKGMSQSGHRAYVFGYDDNTFNEGDKQFSIPETIDLVTRTRGMGLIDYEFEYLQYAPEQEEETKEVKATSVKYYEGDIKPEPNTIFVFGSNPEGRHGSGAAKIAKDQFGALYGQGEGLQGNSYALPTKDLRVKENKGYKSVSPEEITKSIQELYKVAEQNPDKQFKIAYRNTIETSLNGYTGLEMINMFNNAGTIPNNIVFSKEWFDTGKLNITKIKTKPTPKAFGELSDEQYDLLQKKYPDSTLEEIRKTYNNLSEEEKDNLLNCL